MTTSADDTTVEHVNPMGRQAEPAVDEPAIEPPRSWSRAAIESWSKLDPDDQDHLRAELADARAQVAHVEGVVAGLNEELAKVQQYKRLQADDIMTLGQQVGRLETEVADVRAENERLRASANPVEEQPERFRSAVRAVCGVQGCDWPDCGCESDEINARRAIIAWEAWRSTSEQNKPPRSFAEAKAERNDGWPE